MVDPPPASSESIFGRRYRATTIAVMGTVGIVAYNNLAVSAALPEVGKDLGDVVLLPWTISVELLTSGVAVLFAGPLVDSLGARRIFRSSVLGFLVTSAMCAAAPSMAWLILARALQGVTAGVLLTVATTTIGLVFASDVRLRVFAAVSTVWGITSVAGPALAAVLVSVVGWRGVFAFNVPVAIVAAALAWRELPDPETDAEAARVDIRGVALITVVSAAALGTAEGSIGAATIGLAVTAIGLLAYVRHARRDERPVVRIRHVVEPKYRRIHVTSSLVIGSALGASSFLPVYLAGARGTSTATAAFSVVFMSVGWSMAAFAASKLQVRLGAERIVLMASMIAAPMLTITMLAVTFDAPVPLIFALLVGVGAGVGAVSSTGVTILQRRALPSEMGRVNAAHQFVRTMGITYGVGLVGVVILTTVDRRVGDVEAVRELLGGEDTLVNEPVADALAAGYAWALALACVGMVLAVPSAVGLVRHRDEPVPSAP